MFITLVAVFVMGNLLIYDAGTNCDYLRYMAGYVLYYIIEPFYFFSNMPNWPFDGPLSELLSSPTSTEITIDTPIPSPEAKCMGYLGPPKAGHAYLQ